MEEINWGIIGLGNIAEKFIEGFKNVENAKLKAIASKNSDKLDKFKKRFNLDENYCFSNYADLIESNDIDIVYITLPHSMHYENILKCFKKNKNVIVEKPAVISLEQIKNLKNNFNKKIFFAEAFMYRYHPQITKVIELIKKNYIGNLTEMKSYYGINLMKKKFLYFFTKNKRIDKNHRLFNKKLGGGAILDLGCYPSSMSILIASLKSDFKKIQVKDKKLDFYKTGIDINSFATLHFDNNFVSYIGTSFQNNLGKKTIIKGEDGTIIIEDSWHGEPSKIFIEGKYNEVCNISSDKSIYSYEIENFSNNILQNNFNVKYPGMSFEETFLNIKIIDEWLNK
tara:strand:+ start:145 stop:1164 length:1020 start_codon:yes stop_codon:yes gene_type:complete